MVLDLVAEFVMGRVCQGPSLSWAEFVMGRDVPESFCPGGTPRLGVCFRSGRFESYQYRDDSDSFLDQ